MNRRLQLEDGFSLIELITVVMIIGILISITVPTLLGARKRAQDRVVQHKIRLAYAAEKLEFVDSNTYTEDVNALHAQEPAIAMQVGTTPGATQPVFVKVQGGTGELLLSSKSDTGTCFYLSHVPSPSATENLHYARDDSCGSATSQTYTGSW